MAHLFALPLLAAGSVADEDAPSGLRMAFGPILMYFGSNRLKPLPETSLGSRGSTRPPQLSDGFGDDDDVGLRMSDGERFGRAEESAAATDDDNLGEQLFFRVALLPALRLQAGESQ